MQAYTSATEHGSITYDATTVSVVVGGVVYGSTVTPSYADMFEPLPVRRRHLWPRVQPMRSLAPCSGVAYWAWSCAMRAFRDRVTARRATPRRTV